jgi:hypothetical protein
LNYGFSIKVAESGFGLLIYIFMLIFGFDLVCVLVVKILIGFGVNHMKFEYTLRGILGCWICKFDVDFLFRKYWAIVGIYIL